MFKPLSTAYSKELSNYLHNSQGLLSVKKGDFFPLFWRAWVSSFKKNTIQKSFMATGIWPPDLTSILKRFNRNTPEERRVVEEREKDELQLQKARRLELKEQARLYKLQVAQEKRVERERLKEVREKEKAEKMAERAREKAARDSQKAIQQAQKSKRKAS
ncbi:hypothetical protein PtrM4_012800 [Pyrenophora tritici-repentis]|uniref:Uncharacterized protein n=1 Tax=Pyrenophora tritici-repentis TaxID=45151 RepID=A0A834S8X3_9PLEO|nr:hypothetical protein PtrM4_012800 [Pyrenophora tritici-repentis]